MASATYLSNPVVTIAGTDLTDMCSAATLNHLVEALEDTSSELIPGRSQRASLHNEVTLTFYASYAATETYATLSALVGTQTTVVLSPSSAATSATNPEFTLTDCYLESLPVVNAALGTLSTYDIVLTGGTYSVATS
jgi:hypothetical protein